MAKKRAAPKRKPGRPSDYTSALAERICGALADDPAQSLRKLCAAEGMPDRKTVTRWLAQHDEFRRHYAQAREIQADALIDEAREIADDPRFDWVERTSRNGESVVVCDYEHVQRSKLRVDTRKWAAAKLAPHKYGDRVAVDQHVTGQVQHEHKVEHTLAADAETLAQVVAILGEAHALSGNGHDKSAEADAPTIQ